MFFAPHDANRGGIDLCLVLTSEGPFLMCEQPFAAFLFLAARAEESVFLLHSILDQQKLPSFDF